MKNKVLILGCTGMLGSMVLDYLSRNKKIEACATLRDSGALNKLTPKYKDVKFILFDAELNNFSFLNKYRFNWVINCIGSIKSTINEDDSASIKRAIFLNAIFPYNLSGNFYKRSKIIQIATDCVFSGKKGEYAETDLHDATDIYGKTKSLGEVKANNFSNIRCSIIGQEIKKKGSLLEWFLSNKEKKIKGYSNHIWNGVTTLHFAKLCEAIIVNNLKLPNIVHFMPKDKVTKYELLNYLNKNYKKSFIIQRAKAKSFVDRSLSTSYQNLNSNLWTEMGYDMIPSIGLMVREMSLYK